MATELLLDSSPAFANLESVSMHIAPWREFVLLVFLGSCLPQGDSGSVFTMDTANTIEDLQKHGGRFGGQSPFSSYLQWKYRPLLPVISRLKEALVSR
jgi:hypothetical protein